MSHDDGADRRPFISATETPSRGEVSAEEQRLNDNRSSTRATRARKQAEIANVRAALQDLTKGEDPYVIQAFFFSLEKGPSSPGSRISGRRHSQYPLYASSS